MKPTIFLFLLILINTSAHSQNSSEVCYNPNLVKDTTKKSITSMAFQVVKVIASKLVTILLVLENVLYGEDWFLLMRFG